MQDVLSSAQVALPLTEASRTGEARRMAAAMAGDLGFNDTERGKVAIVASEAARNLVQHAKEGELLLRPLLSSDNNGIEILTVDRGPGMRDVDRCFTDGYSTAGTPGTGLGAIRRLSQHFDLYSQPGIGTTLMARLWARPLSSPPRDSLEIGVVSIPYPGEEVCGDGWSVHQAPGRALVLVADGLGHGVNAAQAAQEAIRVFQENPHHTPAFILGAAHGALRGTRGAALAVAEMDLQRGEVRFSGVGNISGVILGPTETHSMVSHSGTVGHTLHKVQEFTYLWPRNSLIILYSDGLTTHWDLQRYPGLFHHHPSLVAAVLYQHHRRGRDDVTVVVLRAPAME